jgi:CRP/FNR family transcriptional regulator, nitrogen oxide reductase regulator
VAAPGVVDLLKANPVFAGLAASELATLAAASRRERLPAREYAFTEGDPALWFCLVLEGRVKIVRQSRAGKDVVLELLGPGEPFGGVAVMEQRPYPASAQATEPSVILKIPRDALLPLAERHPSIIREMAFMVSRRLRAAHDAVKSLAVDPVESRLAATLVRLAAREATRGRRGLTLAPHLTRQTLADMSGTTVETVIRIMSRWQREGLVRDDQGRIALADIEAVRRLAEGRPD